MNITIRVDGSVAIGAGHVMRCLTLAHELKSRQADIRFICRQLAGDCCSLIENQGFAVEKLPAAKALNESFDWELDARQTRAVLERQKKRADWLIVDHYGIAEGWEAHLKPFAKKIMVIDDLANRRHTCDLLLDQNLVEHQSSRYDDLTDGSCIKLLGPRFVLLRQEFRTCKVRNDRSGALQRILVTFGGSDPDNETGKAMQAIRSLNNPKLITDIVVGGANPYKEEIRSMCEQYNNFKYHYQVNNMAELMNAADLAVGAGGVTLWERCYMGLPSVTVCIAVNQIESAKAADAAGATKNLGMAQDIDFSQLAAMLEHFCANPQLVRRMGKLAGELMADNEQGYYELIQLIMEGRNASL